MLASASSNQDASWLEYLRLTLNEIKANENIQALLASGDVAVSFLSSAHPCFITFNSQTPFSQTEFARLNYSPVHLVIARMIYAEIRNNDVTTASNPTNMSVVQSAMASPFRDFTSFINAYYQSILRISSIRDVSNFMTRHFNCQHYVLAFDELSQLRDRDDIGVVEFNPYGSTLRYSSSIRCILCALGDLVRASPRFAVIVASLVTGPLQEYKFGTQHTPFFVPLHPYIDRLDPLSHIIARRRCEVLSQKPVKRVLLSTGGHPRLLSLLIPWLCNRITTDMSSMTLEQAAKVCRLDDRYFRNAALINAVIFGCEISEDMYACTAGTSGMLTRPTDLSTPVYIVASPLVLYVALSKGLVLPGYEGVKTDFDSLVPSEISSENDFELFVANWLTLRLRLGEHLKAILEPKNGNSILKEYLNLPDEGAIDLCAKIEQFNAALPATKGLYVKFEGLQRTRADWDPLIFEKDERNAMVRVALPHNQRNKGFDIIVGRNGAVAIRGHRSVLLIQCKTQESLTVENEGIGQTFDSSNLAATIENSAKNAKEFFKANWKVSLLVLATCKVSKKVILRCRVKGRHARDLYSRTRVVNKGGLRDLFGPSFALALELALGYNFEQA